MASVPAEVATELAHHYSRANDRNKAIQYFRLAGERAVTRGAVVEAEGDYNRALLLLGRTTASGRARSRRTRRSRYHSEASSGDQKLVASGDERAYARAEELAENRRD